MTMTTRNRRGWTLFEMMVVMALVVILGAVAAPSLFSSYTQYRLKSAADGMAAAFARARDSARRHGCSYRLSIIPDTGNYRIAPDNPDAVTGTTNQQGDPLVIEDHLPNGVQIAMGNTEASDPDNPGNSAGSTVGQSDQGQYVVAAVFKPDGTAQTDVQVVLSAKGAIPLAVKLRGLTGAVTTEPMPAGVSHS